MAGKKHILLVEDSPTQALQLQCVFEDREYRVGLANDGTEALAYVQLHAPDVVMSGIVMPDMDGYELCRRIKATVVGKSLDVMLLLSRPSAEDVFRAIEAGADSAITKPWSDEFLCAEVESLLQGCATSGASPGGTMEFSFGGKPRRVTTDAAQVTKLLLRVCQDLIGKNAEAGEVRRDIEDQLRKIEWQNTQLSQRAERATRSAEGVEQLKAALLAQIDELTKSAASEKARLIDEIVEIERAKKTIEAAQQNLKSELGVSVERAQELEAEVHAAEKERAALSLRVTELDAALKRLGTEPEKKQAAPARQVSPGEVIEVSHDVSVAAVERGGRVLIVDPTIAERQHTANQFRQLGYEVLETIEGTRALLAMLKGTLSAVVIEVTLPDMTGFELATAIRKEDLGRGTYTPIIAVTDLVDAGRRARCLMVGVDDVLAKPLSLGELQSSLAVWLPKARKISAARRGSKAIVRSSELDQDMMRVQDNIAMLRAKLDGEKESGPVLRGRIGGKS